MASSKTSISMTLSLSRGRVVSGYKDCFRTHCSSDGGQIRAQWAAAGCS